MKHWNDPPPGVTPRCPEMDCDEPLSWDSPSLYCPKHGGRHYTDVDEPIDDEPDPGGRCYR